MVRSRTPSTLFLAVASSPLVVVGLIGWTRLGLARTPALPPAPVSTLDSASLGAAALAGLWGRFEREVDGRTAELWELRGWLDGLGLRDGGARPLEHGVPLAPGTGGVHVTREDLAGSTRLVLHRTEPGEAAGGSGTPLGAFAAVPRPWEGSGATLLARQLDCTLCHVTVVPAPGSRRPVRVVALGDVALRADSRVGIHGTLQLGGELRDGAGEALVPHLALGLTFAPIGRGVELGPDSADLAPTTPLDGLRLGAREGRLLARCTRGAVMLDRPLPSAFPSLASVHATQPAGAGLAGGRGGAVPFGARLTDEDAGASLEPSRAFSGHVWAVGTDAAPLTLDGEVVVAGDLLLAGVVRGRGVLRAAGSIVVAGSLRVDGHLALVAGSDVLAGAAFGPDGVGPFVRAAAPSVTAGPDWLTPARIRRMGERVDGPVVLEAFVYSARHILVVAGTGGHAGDVRVRGGLVGDVVAVHAPGEFTLEDDPEARDALAFEAPRGLELVRVEAAPRAAPVVGEARAPALPATGRYTLR